MELIKKNIHMDCTKKTVVNQITIDEDFIIPDTKEDIKTVIFDCHNIKLGDMKESKDHVSVSGEMEVSILYVADNGTGSVASLVKVIPFHDELYLEGAEKGINLEAILEAEDVNVSIINSRKLNIRSLINVKIMESKLYDEEAMVDIVDLDSLQCCKKKLELSQLAVCKKDIYRIRKEIEIGNNLPNIKNIVFQTMHTENVNIKVGDEKFLIQGEICCFFMYLPDEEDESVQNFDTTFSFHGEVPCSGINDNMFPDISCVIGSKEVEVKSDFDGEQRIFALEVVLNLDIKLYEEERVDIISDVYGIENEVEVETVQGNFRKLLVCNNGKCKVNEKINLKESAKPIMQLMHCMADAVLDETIVLDQGIQFVGTLFVKGIYITGDDDIPCASFKETLPFSYTIDVPEVTNDSTINTCVSLEQLNVTMLDAREMEVKAYVAISVVAFKEVNEKIMKNVNLQNLDVNKRNNLPSMVIYQVDKGETLWDIGKKYCVPMKKLRETNQLTSDDCTGLDKILVIK